MILVVPSALPFVFVLMVPNDFPFIIVSMFPSWFWVCFGSFECSFIVFILMVLSILLFVYVLVVTSYGNGFELSRQFHVHYFFLFFENNFYFFSFGLFDGLKVFEVFKVLAPMIIFFFNTNINGDHLFLS